MLTILTSENNIAWNLASIILGGVLAAAINIFYNELKISREQTLIILDDFKNYEEKMANADIELLNSSFGSNKDWDSLMSDATMIYKSLELKLELLYPNCIASYYKIAEGHTQYVAATVEWQSTFHNTASQYTEEGKEWNGPQIPTDKYKVLKESQPLHASFLKEPIETFKLKLKKSKPPLFEKLANTFQNQTTSQD